MFQILDLGLWEGISYNIVKHLYGTVMRFYDFILDLARNHEVMNFASFASSLYVIAGLFMLFRAVIGMVQMIINPDQISDKNMGASKLITRIVVVIVLLLTFQPGGILLGESGLLARIEDALLADDGLINNVMEISVESRGSEEVDTSNKISIDQLNMIPFSKYLFEEVSADSKWSKTCWFWHEPNKNGNGSNANYLNSDTFKIEFANYDNGGIKIDRKDNKKFYAKFLAGGDYFLDKNQKEIEKKYKQLSKLKLSEPIFGNAPSKVSNCQNWYIQSRPEGYALRQQTSTSNTDTYWRGYNTFKGFLEAINDDYKDINSDKVQNDDDGVIGAIASENAKRNIGNLNYSKKSTNFGTSLISSFQECTASDDTARVDCEKKKASQFDTTSSKEIVNLMKNEELTLSFIIAIIVGIGVLIYLIVLSVDIILRGLKLSFLELLAPIPIISYVDPKDKIFNQWLKMFIATYLDLFIKLLAIGIAIAFLDQLTTSDIFEGNVFRKFIAIIAVLVFAKAVPSMISKIFGLDNMGGSFKEIGSMLKAGAGFAAGAAIGGAVGAATGQGFGGRIAGATKGMMMGAGSGAKGKILGGAQGIAAKNDLINKQKADGLNFWDRAAIGFYNATGISPSGQMFQDQIKASQDVTSANKEWKNFAEDEAEKKGQIFTGQKANFDRNGKFTGFTTAANMNLKEEKAFLDSMKGQDTSNMNATEKQEHAELVAKLEKNYMDNKKIAGATRTMQLYQQGDAEMVQYVDNVNEKIADAAKLGVEFKDASGNVITAIDPTNVTASTSGDLKDSAIAKQTEIAKAHETEIARSKYLNKKS